MNIHANVPNMEDGGVTLCSCVHVCQGSSTYASVDASKLCKKKKPTIILELSCQDPVSFKSQISRIKTLGHD